MVGFGIQGTDHADIAEPFQAVNDFFTRLGAGCDKHRREQKYPGRQNESFGFAGHRCSFFGMIGPVESRNPEEGSYLPVQARFMTAPSDSSSAW
ncbi:MAG: hypothetical protein ACD_75C00338G0003 [uncultured bacterium]|nr:MAG: hypothetical protein ACD_75C00338G0003 [uncultured bacterium]